jgi:hypothetical protein
LLPRRLNVSLRKSLTTLVGLTLAAVVLILVPVTPAAAQDDQDEALAYHAWFAANQQQDNAKAVDAAEAYLEKYPSGEYAEFLSKWLAPAQMARLNEAIKAGQVDQMLAVGNRILAKEPENLNVVYALAFQLRRRELLAKPRSYAHAAEAVRLSQKAIDLVGTRPSPGSTRTWPSSRARAAPRTRPSSSTRSRRASPRRIRRSRVGTSSRCSPGGRAPTPRPPTRTTRCPRRPAARPSPPPR